MFTVTKGTLAPPTADYADGRMDNAGVVVGECRFVVNVGVYVVCVGTQVYKVAVR